MNVSLFQFSPNCLPQVGKFRNHPSISNNRPNTKIPCTKNKLSDSALALDLAINVQKINTHLEQKEKAMKKSKEFLFTELCQYLSLKEEEMNKKWRKMREEEKWVLINKFVDEWSVHFYPLSARSVKEMVDEYLQDDNRSDPPMFPGLKRLLGMSKDA
ncbi:hypothetical protein ERO13_A12G031600v2 [Gossypium hirsutum]|uniref:DUF7026 domain-containing protein n=4 Tax=Gossypium TaxID=3633 RepID=A0ABR0MLA9_GOSAR|nr:uncharacterized protein LOC107932159 [Gossypium hirsutum]XP_017637379.1 uncharacterized protein LOC108479349 [Gossypium arboreum]TYG88569.1 hypothetical protein ES288_A12G032000v1 [Gossypium darwinii]TYJ03500.1 hypothetical protein E1A91_A12G032100v1 [Gossypium mustelinum]KAG4168548.1 hypothetical protein ERO13_A12G031600v2 [Gossypium hirsutum]KAK5774774.1 hypothetical protein PVK06_042630 [Gossypium arboreum]